MRSNSARSLACWPPCLGLGGAAAGMRFRLPCPCLASTVARHVRCGRVASSKWKPLGSKLRSARRRPSNWSGSRDFTNSSSNALTRIASLAPALCERDRAELRRFAAYPRAWRREGRKTWAGVRRRDSAAVLYVASIRCDVAVSTRIAPWRTGGERDSIRFLQ